MLLSLAGVTMLARVGCAGIVEAVAGGDYEQVKALLEAGEDPNARGPRYPEYPDERYTLLHIAVRDPRLVKLLLEHGADPDLTDENGETALHEAAVDGYRRTAVLLLQHGADPNARDAERETPLHRALSGAWRKIVELLLRWGADPDVQWGRGYTALHYAVDFGDRELIDLLVGAGADLRVGMHGGGTALQMAAATGDPELAAYLAGQGLPWTVDAAAAVGDVRRLRELLKAGGDPNARGYRGDPALYTAALLGQREAVEVLLRHGADPGCRTPRITEHAGIEVPIVRGGDTPLDAAVSHKHVAIARLLLASMPEGQPSAPERRELLTIAAASGDVPTLRLLLQHGAGASRPEGSHDWSALAEAVLSARLAAAKVLLEHGTDVDGVEPWGLWRAPLLLAASVCGRPAQEPPAWCSWPVHMCFGQGPPRHTVALVRELLERGADVHVRDSNGRTPLHYAADCPQVAGLLLDQGADVGAEDSEGFTPVQFAKTEQGARLLIQRGAKWALQPAVVLGDLGKLRELLEAGADPNRSSYDRDAALPLRLAVQHGRGGAIRLLAENGAAVTGDDDWSPLGDAVTRGHPRVVRELLAHGVDANGADTHGTPALLMAARLCHGWVTASSSRPAGLGGAVVEQRRGKHSVAVVRELLQRGADVHVRDNGGPTPLHYATDCPQLARLLLDYGADMEAKDGDGFTPVQYAQTVPGARLLIQRGARWALQPAVVLDDLGKLRELLDAGADPNRSSPEVRSPLGLAAQHGRTDAVGVLVVHGAEVDGDGCDYSPLLEAATYGQTDVARELLAEGADPNGRELPSGWPLYAAAARGDVHLVRLLLEHGAVVTFRHQTDRLTPLQAAKRRGHTEVVEILREHGAKSHGAKYPR